MRDWATITAVGVAAGARVAVAEGAVVAVGSAVRPVDARSWGVGVVVAPGGGVGVGVPVACGVAVDVATARALSGVSAGVLVGVTGVAVAVGMVVAVGMGVLVDGGVLVDAGSVGGTDVAVGGTSVAVGGTDVAVGGTDVEVGGIEVAVGGTSVAVGGTDVAVGGGVLVGACGLTPHPLLPSPPCGMPECSLGVEQSGSAPEGVQRLPALATTTAVRASRVARRIRLAAVLARCT
jgi:hypothetical protein